MESLSPKQAALFGQEIIPFLENKFSLLVMPRHYQGTVQLKKLWSDLIPHEMKGIQPIIDNLFLCLSLCCATNKTRIVYKW